MRKIYILASSPSDLTEMADLAVALKQRGNAVTLAYFNEGGTSTLDAKVNARIQDFQNSTAIDRAYILEPRSSFLDLLRPLILRFRSWRDKDAAPGASDQNNLESQETSSVWKQLTLLRQKAFSTFKSIARWLVRRLDQVLMRRLRAIFAPTFNDVLLHVYLILVYGRNLKTFRAELRAGKFDAILIPEDIVGSVWPLVIKAGHERQIPTLVFPYTLANQKEAVQSLKSEPAFQRENNRLAARLFPRWRWQADGIDLVRLPSFHIFAHEWFGITPPAPWLMNSGFANVICVDSPASLEYSVNSGVPQSKLLVTGSVSQDHLHAQKAVKDQALAALRESLGLAGNKPLLLISGCPNQLAAKVPHCAFATIEEVAQHVGHALAPLREDYHIVVRPHPNYLEFADLMRPFGVASTMVPTSRLVPLADLFIGFASATIRWAIACAVPTVNYDIFNYRYNDFGNAHGVITLTDPDAFISTLAALSPSGEMLGHLRKKIERDSNFWSYMDGGCMQRIQAAIDMECSKSRVMRTSS